MIGTLLMGALLVSKLVTVPIKLGYKAFKWITPGLTAFPQDKEPKGKKLKFKEVEFKTLKQNKQSSIHILKPQITKSNYDKRLDEVIDKRFGNTLKRATVFDIFPLELSKEQKKNLNEHMQLEWSTYYDYSRDNLTKISSGYIPKAIVLNFDGDKQFDNAAITYDEQQEKLFLSIINRSKVLYHEEFHQSYIESVNEGRYPIDLAINNEIYTINSPTLKLIAFDGPSAFLYYDRKDKNWKLITEEI